MSASPFDLSSLVDSYRAAGAATLQFWSQLGGKLSFDANGSVNVDFDAVGALAKQALPQDKAQAFIGALRARAASGLALLGSLEDVQDSRATAIPWSALTDTIGGMAGTPPAVRTALGIGAGAAPGDAVAQLRARFPNAPALATTPLLGTFLSQNPALGLVALQGAADRVEPTDLLSKDSNEQGDTTHSTNTSTNTGSGSLGGLPLPTPSAAVAAAQCFANGQWGSYVQGKGLWWTWIAGCSVKLGQDCANKVGTLLTGFGGGTALLTALSTAAAGGPIALTAATTFEIAAFLIGTNILLVNGPGGVIIHFNWPMPGIGTLPIATSA
jgi:hypothetical protein